MTRQRRLHVDADRAQALLDGFERCCMHTHKAMGTCSIDIGCTVVEKAQFARIRAEMLADDAEHVRKRLALALHRTRGAASQRATSQHAIRCWKEGHTSAAKSLCLKRREVQKLRRSGRRACMGPVHETNVHGM